jgi:hypothetical protein
VLKIDLINVRIMHLLMAFACVRVKIIRSSSTNLLFILIELFLHLYSCLIVYLCVTDLQTTSFCVDPTLDSISKVERVKQDT